MSLAAPRVRSLKSLRFRQMALFGQNASDEDETLAAAGAL
jgi:hypothetical protein